ncbi:OmpA family lipoprotein [Bacterioplanes sanyensis]|uniref:OmpA family protein n=1 Tax=Bacterioplanes sanyensis TaxID=1249553 RepID=UPI001679943C|nr:OmpA family protein [Bacterioplanes sanyensis]GGY48987.1 OmpA family lipoprotein [Bacterioplanes sanyensis]
MKKLMVALSVAALATGCATYDPYTGEKETSKTAIGAGIGAGVGVLAAYLDNRDEKDVKKRNQRILASAAGGAAIGGGIGYYMDAQEAKLRKQLRGTGVKVERDGDNVNLIMPGNITFASGSSAVASSFYEVLNSVALVIKEYDRTLVVVAGHTDSVGSESTNQRLSEQRAQSVSAYLKSRGIKSVRLETVGFGERSPIASNATAAGKEQNRRVEITLVPVTQ